MADVTCTKEQPWDGVRRPGVRVVHPDASEVDQRGGYPGGDYVDYECPHCGKNFSVELPQ